MRVSALKPDEIEVECELRAILTGSTEALVNLQQQIESEKAGTISAPHRMHSKAAKNPNAEVEVCRSKLIRLRDDISNLKSIEAAEQTHTAQQIWSRLTHVKGRLDRVSLSPTYQEAARRLLQSCAKLLESLDAFLQNSDDLNNSIKTVEGVELDVVNPAPSAQSIDITPNPQTTMELAERNPNFVNMVISGEEQSSPKTSQVISVDHSALLLEMMRQVKQLSEQVQVLSLKRVESQPQILNPPISAISSGDVLPAVSLIKENKQMVLQDKQTRVQFHRSSPVHSNQPIFTNPISSVATINSVTQASVSTSGSNSHHQVITPTIPSHHNSTFLNCLGSDQQNTIHGENLGPPLYRDDLPRRQQLSRCGISYSGSSSGITVEMFFFQLETIAASMNLSEESLMFEMSTVLKDIALQWYWTYRRHHPFASWSILKHDFLERFKDRRTDFEIRRTIEDRKQQANEPFIDFYHHVWGLTLQCRTPYRDEEFIQLLISNMKPALQYHLTDQRFTNINDLIKSCTAWEATFKRFRTPVDNSLTNRRTINELQTIDYNTHITEETKFNSPMTAPVRYEPISALHTSPRNPTILQDRQNTAAMNTRANSPSLGTHIICYNCSDIGHVFVDCPLAPTGIFCYRCGLKGTITPKCPRCAETLGRIYRRAENSSRGQWRSGNQGPPNTLLPKIPREDAASNTDSELGRMKISNS